MKKMLLALVLSYVATFAAFLAVAYANNQFCQIVGTVTVWQELEVADYRDGEYGNIESSLPFFFAEIGASKEVYRRVHEQLNDVPHFGLTTFLQHRQFKRGLFVELYDYDWKLKGQDFTRSLQQALPPIRDAIIEVLESKGLSVTPKGKVTTLDQRSERTLGNYAQYSLLFLPSFAITALVFRKRRAVKRVEASPLEPTDFSDTLAAPVAERGRAPMPARANVISFVFGCLLAGLVASGFAVYFQNRLRARHADCPLDSTEVFLRSMANLSPTERASLEATLNSALNQGILPGVTNRIGSFRTAVRLYERRTDEEWCRTFTAEKITEVRESLEQAMGDKELSFHLRPQFEEMKSEIEAVLERLPEVRVLVGQE